MADKYWRGREFNSRRGVKDHTVAEIDAYIEFTGDTDVDYDLLEKLSCGKFDNDKEFAESLLDDIDEVSSDDIADVMDSHGECNGWYFKDF